jgi:hypothetical protein
MGGLAGAIIEAAVEAFTLLTLEMFPDISYY